MREYIIHPYTKEVDPAGDFQCYENWRSIKFINATAELEEAQVENGDFELVLKLETGEEKVCRVSEKAYFEGRKFYLPNS